MQDQALPSPIQPPGEPPRRALQEIVAEPDVQTRLMDLSAMPVGSSPEVLSTLVRTDLDKLGALIKSIGGLQKD